MRINSKVLRQMSSPKELTPGKTAAAIPRIAILVETSSSWGRRVIFGVGSYFRKFGPAQLFVEARGIEEALRVPAGWEGSGVIARITSSAMSRELESLRIPVVNVSGMKLHRTIFPQVTTNMKMLADEALAHFVERAFKNFAYFSLLGLSYVATQRDAFVKAVRNRGSECAVFSVKPQIGAEPSWNLDLVELASWIESLPKPVGILTWNASGAREILYACQIAGLLVPEEVSVLSASDDDVLCEYLHPPLSGVLIGAEQIGHDAAALLHGLIQGKAPPKDPVLIPPMSVVTRQSTDILATSDRGLIRAISYIRENASQPIQVADVVRHAGLSRRVLERRFLRVLGRSPASEIRRVHLSRARSLLLETELSIPSVAEASGFGSPEYFSYAFKDEIGKTPLDYRKTVRSR